MKIDIANLFYWITAIILWSIMIYNYFNNKKLRKNLIKYNDDFIKKLESNYLDFVKKKEDDYSDFVTQYNERADLLSRENNKLRDENETLKERLRDLGITYFD